MTHSFWRRAAGQAAVLLLMLAVLECALRFAGFVHSFSRTLTGAKDAAATVLCGKRYCCNLPAS